MITQRFTIKQALGSVILLVWFITLAFISGPVRWEVAHTYQHLVDRLENSLPLPTKVVGLPVLGLGALTPLSIAYSYGVLGGCLVGSGVFAPRNMACATTWKALSDWLMLGGTLYTSTMFLFVVVIVFSLWLPFGLL